ncbi:hypothetical protein PtA15_18A437 [Puccinia triticina]|uniref:Uncharacterized protein n=1 Tax=Puccinia triticina TaxID=208348 RepID=A0ABY7D7M5_9BASI|nr:uncharacterized protein PtA15_18A437 [Puccinia triticina]WAQ93376.1 hypothetical protein PtA15_18A437 [Puccinia triticina]
MASPDGSPSPAPSPSASNIDRERKSFQGEHHRHRFMHNPHLRPPNNAHYSPHYGSPTSQQQPSPSSKRKPPPPLEQQPNINNKRTNTPSPTHNNTRKRTNTPSPTPSPRSGTAIVRKIGSALTAPFRHSASRRGSDASEIGPSDIHDLRQLVTPEHLPWMPSPGSGGADENQDGALTEAQQIIRQTRTPRDERGSPERVLRVVNGSASLSTRASTSRQSALDQLCNTTQPLKISSRHSFQSALTTTTATTTTKAGCSKCLALEHQLAVESDRARNLELALDAQTQKLDQLRTWATAKVSHLDTTLRQQEQLLQQVEQQMAQKRGPDIKSDYLIALQKDFVDLNARLALLESKHAPQDDADTNNTPEDDLRQSEYISTLRDQRPARDKTRAYSTPPLATTTPGAHARAPWKPASPATMASKLRPPSTSTPASPSARSTPTTPVSGASPRPRYTSALAAKAPSPLGFAGHSHLRRTPDLYSRAYPGIPDSPGSPSS